MILSGQRTQLSIVVLIVALAGLPGDAAWAGVIPVTGVPVPELADFDQEMLDLMELHDLEGGVLAVSVNGCVVYQRGFGWRERSPETIPLPENTPMRLASVEKPLTAATIRHLANLGYFSLGDYVFDLEQPFGGILQIQPWQSLGDDRLNNITINHLLRHTGGWDAEFINFDPQFKAIEIANAMEGVSSPPGRENTVRYMLSQPLQFPPGVPHPPCDEDADGVCLREPTPCVCNTYSNFGYMVLGLIVEHFVGPPHVDAIRHLTLTPQMWVPATELFTGRTFSADQSPREPRYRCPGCRDCVNVFNPGGSGVSCPYGGWDHESMTGHGNLVASAAPLLTFLDIYVVGGPDIGMLQSGTSGNWGHTGALTGTSTIASQRHDGVNIVVLFNQRMPNDDPDLAATVAAAIYDLIGDPPTVTWPTLCVDGSWVDFDATESGYGGFNDPFHTMETALASTAPGVKLRLMPGTSNWTGTLSTRMRIDAPFGLATIGQ
ncbi:MAG: beta-lactamase family protein [Phycisphaerales bacterium]|nr:MAG: beta-lactamase family protein [Phycisphaerales bacterium]